MIKKASMKRVRPKEARWSNDHRLAWVREEPPVSAIYEVMPTYSAMELKKFSVNW